MLVSLDLNAISYAMSKKTLNKINLELLGAETLAALVMDLVQGSAALQRRARLEISAAQGPNDIAADIRKRFATLRRSAAFVNWRKQKALVKDLDGLLRMIETNVAPHNADDAFDLLWSFLQLAPSIHERTDDSSGAVGTVFRDAIDAIATISDRVAIDPKTLAERILDSVTDAGYGEFDGIIPATADALGDEGLDYLKAVTNAWAEVPPSADEVERYGGFGLSLSAADRIRRNKELTQSIILADVADAQGDVDGYMARYSPEQLTYGTIAPRVAYRLLGADRVDEAMVIVSRAMAADVEKSYRQSRHDLNLVYEECLERQGKTAELREYLWQSFAQTLDTDSLRKHLKLLPDFDDIAAEEKAMDLAEAFSDLEAAIDFLVSWPALNRAARMVLSRAEYLNGNQYETLTPAADFLSHKHPLAAVLLRRAMIEDALNGAKSKRYSYAARHLAECWSSNATIDDYGTFPDHSAFVGHLKQIHHRKSGFWELVSE